MHTYMWFDPTAQRAVVRPTCSAGVDAVAFMLDCPPETSADVSAFTVVIEQFVGRGVAPALARQRHRARSCWRRCRRRCRRAVRELCLEAGVVPLQGQREALEALDLAGAVGEAWRGAACLGPLCEPGRMPPERATFDTLAEYEAKTALARVRRAGAAIATRRAATPQEPPRELGLPGGHEGGRRRPRAQDRGRRRRAERRDAVQPPRRPQRLARTVGHGAGRADDRRRRRRDPRRRDA